MNWMFIIFNTLFLMILYSTLYFLLNKKSQHPMIMMSLLILYTLITTLYLSKTFSSFFMSYLMFMVFIGGVMVMFLYLVSLTNKDKYNIKLKFNEIFTIWTLSFTTIIIMILPSKAMWNFTNSNNMDTSPYNPSMDSESNTFMYIDNMYSILHKPSIICVMILLMVLISVVKMCAKNSGPIRQIRSIN